MARVRVVCCMVILLGLALSGCSLLSEKIALDTTGEEGNPHAIRTAGEMGEIPRLAIARRAALGAIQRSSAFEAISARALDLDSPLVEMVNASIAVVVFDLEPSDEDKLRGNKTTACPFAMFHVDVSTGEILSANQAIPSPRTKLLQVRDLLTERQYTLRVPSEVVAAFQQEAKEFEARRSRVEPKRLCDESLEEPYEYCYDVWVPAHFIEPEHTWCRDMCSPEPFETWSYIGCLTACDLMFIVWGHWEEECEWIYPCDW